MLLLLLLRIAGTIKITEIRLDELKRFGWTSEFEKTWPDYLRKQSFRPKNKHHSQLTDHFCSCTDRWMAVLVVIAGSLTKEAPLGTTPRRCDELASWVSFNFDSLQSIGLPLGELLSWLFVWGGRAMWSRAIHHPAIIFSDWWDDLSWPALWRKRPATVNLVLLCKACASACFQLGLPMSFCSKTFRSLCHRIL